MDSIQEVGLKEPVSGCIQHDAIIFFHTLAGARLPVTYSCFMAFYAD